MYLKRLLIAGILMAGSSTSWAQQDPQFSQYMFNAPYWSAALTGVDGKSSLTAFSRSQWLGYETSDGQDGAPTTQFLNFTMPLTLFKTPLSLGATVIYDQLGPMSNSQFQLSIAHHWDFPRGRLSAGIRPSVNSQKVDFSQLNFVNPEDELNTGTSESQMAFDLDAGVAYSTEEYTIGLGVNHFLKPAYDYGSSSVGYNEPLDFLYNLYGEYRYVISYKVTLSPSALIQSDIKTYTFNLGLVATYNSKLWAGVSYRNADAIVGILGYSFLKDNSLKLGYSFDYVIHDQDVKSQTSHELYLRFNLPSISTGDKKIIRTPRFRY